MAELIWSPRAIRDINEIAEFISKDSIQYAKAQARKFIEEAKILERYPIRAECFRRLGIVIYGKSYVVIIGSSTRSLIVKSAS